MPPHSQSLEEEGAMIVAFKLVRNNQFQEQSITDILMSPAKLGPNNSGTRNIQDNLSDLKAQVAANNSGIRLLKQLVNEYDLDTVHSYMEYIQKNAEVAVRSMLKEFAMKHGPKTQAVDYMGMFHHPYLFILIFFNIYIYIKHYLSFLIDIR